MARHLSVLVLAALVSAAISTFLAAQELPPEIDSEGVQTLTRGPLHEAFASPTLADPQPTLVAPKRPPADIDEIPPEYKPDGDDVQWIPGYWAWDDENRDYLWVSGVWRDPPPGKRWVPGYWTEVAGGFQWAPGFWVGEETTTFDYYDTPPQSLEQGPTSDSPGDNYFWSPGVWIHQETQYRWRPGYWCEHQPDWVWTPARWVWTPRGCVYIPGCWDRRLAVRGQCFAPVAFSSVVFSRPGFTYTPRCVINVPNLFVHMWVRPSYCHYYYGNFYGATYANWNLTPWCTFSARPRCYDPLLTWCNVHYAHSGINYLSRVQSWHNYYDRHVDYRPPRTWREQVQVVNNITNITNINVNNSNNVNINVLQQNVLAQDLHSVANRRQDALNEMRLRQLELRQRRDELAAAKSVKTLHDWRRDEEKVALTASLKPAAGGRLTPGPGPVLDNPLPGVQRPGEKPDLATLAPNPAAARIEAQRNTVKKLAAAKLPDTLRVPLKEKPVLKLPTAPGESGDLAGETKPRLPGGVKVNELGKPSLGQNGLGQAEPGTLPSARPETRPSVTDAAAARERVLQDLRERQQKQKEALEAQIRGRQRTEDHSPVVQGVPPGVTELPSGAQNPLSGGKTTVPGKLDQPKPSLTKPTTPNPLDDRLRELRERQQRAAEQQAEAARKAQADQQRRTDELRRQQQELLDRAKRSTPKTEAPRTQPVLPNDRNRSGASTPKFELPQSHGGSFQPRTASSPPRVVTQPRVEQPRVEQPRTLVRPQNGNAGGLGSAGRSQRGNDNRERGK